MDLVQIKGARVDISRQLMHEPNRSATNGDYALGNERFREEIAAVLGRRAAPALARRPPRSVVSDVRQMDMAWES
jgi:hypothetical protein